MSLLELFPTLGYPTNPTTTLPPLVEPTLLEPELLILAICYASDCKRDKSSSLPYSFVSGSSGSGKLFCVFHWVLSSFPSREAVAALADQNTNKVC